MKSLNLKNTRSSTHSEPCEHNSLTITYLKREIACLEKQLKRIRTQNKPIYEKTIATYEEMINMRKSKLHEHKTQVNTN